MPAYCTHYIFACELLPALTELAGFDLNRDAVMLGTQGPDVFLFHRTQFPMKSKKSPAVINCRTFFIVFCCCKGIL